MKKWIIISTRLVLVLYLAAVAYICFAKFESIPTFASNDKAVHFLLFVPYAFLVYFSAGKHYRKGWRSIAATLLIFFSGAVIAGATEIIQGSLPYRSADPLDFRADITAIAASSLIVLIIDICSRKSS